MCPDITPPLRLGDSASRTSLPGVIWLKCLCEVFIVLKHQGLKRSSRDTTWGTRIGLVELVDQFWAVSEITSRLP